MSKWTYSRYDHGHQRQLPEGASIDADEEDNVSALEDLAAACAEDDHNNYDGWEGDRNERDIYLFRDGVQHSYFSVHVEYEPVFQASFVKTEDEGNKP